MRGRDDVLAAAALRREGEQELGVVRFSGLGDMAAKLAKAMGAEVVISTITKDHIRLLLT